LPAQQLPAMVVEAVGAVSAGKEGRPQWAFMGL